MEPMTMMALGAGLGAAGSVSNYLGGKSEAKRKQHATDDYERTSAKLYYQMAKDAWAQGSERQRATGDVIKGLIPTMGQASSAAPDVAGFLPEGPSGVFNADEFRQWMANAGQTQQGVTQANADATQAGMDRESLMRALDALGYTSGIEGKAQSPAHARLQWQKQQELEAARAQLEAVLGSTGNGARNMQLLGSLLGTAGQATMMYGAMGGGGPAAPAGGAIGPQYVAPGPSMTWSQALGG